MPAPARPMDRLRWVVAIGTTLILLVLVILLATIPVPQRSTFGFDISSSGSQTVYYSQSLCPVGADAEVSYSSHGGRNASFNVVDPAGTPIWRQDSAQGSTTFTVQVCGSYQFGLYESGGGAAHVSVTLSYFSPII